MEAKELRIGNCILKNGSNYIVDTLFFVDVYDGTAMGFDLQPIPLTDEILLKCGFIKEKIMTSSFSIGKLTIDIGCDKIHPYGRVYFNSWAIIEKKIEYLHQLQNLYFALTNEELTLNL